jgi:hypothetical protein
MGTLVLLAFALAWVPAGSLPVVAQRLPEPARTHMLGSALLTLGIAVWRLARPLPVREGAGTGR